MSKLFCLPAFYKTYTDTTILTIPDQLPSGLVAQLEEQRLSVLEEVGIPPESEIFFSLLPSGLISFIGLSLRRNHLAVHFSTFKPLYALIQIVRQSKSDSS